MATDPAKADGSLDTRLRFRFRCHGCGVRFRDDAVGPGRCPRCGAIGGHDRLGRPEDSG